MLFSPEHFSYSVNIFKSGLNSFLFFYEVSGFSLNPYFYMGYIYIEIAYAFYLKFEIREEMKNNKEGRIMVVDDKKVQKRKGKKE